MKILKAILKCFAICLVTVVTKIARTVLSISLAISGNEAALMQMENSADSSLWIRLHTECNNYAWMLDFVWVTPVLVALLAFGEDIAECVRKHTSRKTNQI